MPAPVQPHPQCTARAGRMLRFVAGADRLPELPFAAPDAPRWVQDASIRLEWIGNEFALLDSGLAVVRGRARVPSFAVDFEVGPCRILGFGAATGGADRNGAQFRVLTRDTLFYGIPGASYTAMPFFIMRGASRSVGVLVATTYPLDVAVEDGTVRLQAACDTAGAPVDVIVFQGSMAEIVRDLSALVGRTFLPPAWALGFQQSRWSYKSADEVLGSRTPLARARPAGRRDPPRHPLHGSIPGVHVASAAISRIRRRLHRELASLGLADAGDRRPGRERGALPGARHAAGRRHAAAEGRRRSRTSARSGRVPRCSRISRSRGRATTWGKLHQPLVDAGVAGFWNDMNDPVLQAGEVYDPLAEDVHHHGVPHARVRNLYANDMAEATVSGLRTLRTGQATVRAVAVGLPRHPAPRGGLDRRQPFQLGALATEPRHGAQPRPQRRADHGCRRRRLWSRSRQVLGRSSRCDLLPSCSFAGWNSARSCRSSACTARCTHRARSRGASVRGRSSCPDASCVAAIVCCRCCTAWRSKRIPTGCRWCVRCACTTTYRATRPPGSSCSATACWRRRCCTKVSVSVRCGCLRASGSTGTPARSTPGPGA